MVLYPSANKTQTQQRPASQPDRLHQSMEPRLTQTENDTYLSQNQQDLLLAALNSQAIGRLNTTSKDGETVSIKRSDSDLIRQQPRMSGMNDSALFMSPQDAELDTFNSDLTPDLDYLDADSGFDFDNADLGGELIGALPGSDEHHTNGNAESHEKRKSPDENDASEEGDAKRQETQEGEKGAKKPGRKPLTSEPTTKRKAQNRAAQRAFRERKEKHVKDLETKVADLTKTQEADKHENGMLKAQVERLQMELREFRKRLSLNSGASAGAIKSSPPLSAQGSQSRSSTLSAQGKDSAQFQFDFPKFGALPGSQIFGNQQNYSNGASSGALKRESSNSQITQSPTEIGNSHGVTQMSHPSRTNSSEGRSMSLQSTHHGRLSDASSNPNMSFSSYSSANNMHGFASTLPQMNSGDPFGDLFSPSILKSTTGNSYFSGQQPRNASTTSFDPSTGGDSTAGFNRVFQFNGGSSGSDSASPSNSSSSQWNVNGANSSCGTSPEPSHGSPANKADKSADSFSAPINPQYPSSTEQQSMVGFTGNNIDYNLPSAQTFDPVLFGEMRDSNNPESDFTGGFFDDALNQGPYDFGSPSNLFGILQSPQQTSATLSASRDVAQAPTPSRNLMAEIDKTRDGGDDDYGLPIEQPKKVEGVSRMISCNNIWNQLQSNPAFQSGTFDLDSLCSELRAKARCSESGVVVDQDYVDATLKRLGKKDDSGKFVPAPTLPEDLPPVVFQQEGWDNVLKKFRQNN